MEGDPELRHHEGSRFARVTSVACGRRHTLAVDDQGGVWSWGQNSAGQCGLVHLNNPIPEPEPVNFVQGRRANRVACGAQHSLVVTSGGEVFVFGDNTRGALGLTSESEIDTISSGRVTPTPTPPHCNAHC